MDMSAAGHGRIIGAFQSHKRAGHLQLVTVKHSGNLSGSRSGHRESFTSAG